MPSRHAAACGFSIGLLTGITISMLLKLDMVDTVYRSIVLAVSGAWMGGLLACLNDLLHPSQERVPEHRKRLP